ncbi:MAG: LacI family transcriptional regulator [Terricaulis sp.]|nr:LacI family transcriptional regulator [Terricaulis sp.]
MVTIHDVAKHAGVSPMTVSRVVNGERYVRAETRDAVLASVRALNYAPNQAARALAGAEERKVGLLYGNPSAAYLGNFCSARSMSAGANQHSSCCRSAPPMMTMSSARCCAN